MLKFRDTVSAGSRAEKSVYDALRQYTRHVYRNCRVDTLYTKNGVTEIDIIAAVADVILIVEVKNVKSIDGSVSAPFWTMDGAETGLHYSALNVLTQNRIHVRSFKDAWVAKQGKFPAVISVVVVPNGCVIPEDIQAAGVLTVGDFSVQLASLCADGLHPKYGYQLDYIVGSDGRYVERSDFVGGQHG